MNDEILTAYLCPEGLLHLQGITILIVYVNTVLEYYIPQLLCVVFCNY